MAGKKEFTIDDAVIEFQSVMQRASLSDYRHVNQLMFSKNTKGKTIVVIPDSQLWLKLVETEGVKEHITEADVGEVDNRLIEFGSNLDDVGWISLDAEAIYQGKLIKITVDGKKHQLIVNKDLLPLKLKKSECNNMMYRISQGSQGFLLLKKRFDSKIEGGGFTILRAFQIL